MSSDKDSLVRARNEMKSKNFDTAEQILLSTIQAGKADIEVYNLLMELYFYIGLYDKVISFFKETTVAYPDLNLDSYFMIADNLLKAEAIKECELVLLLAQKNHPDKITLISNRLLRLYLHPAIAPNLVYNYVKNNFSILTLDNDTCLLIMQKLATPEHMALREDFFFFIFNTSANNIHRKKIILKELLCEINSPEAILEILEKLNHIGIALEPAIFFTISSHLCKLNSTAQAKQILEDAMQKEPESEYLFREALEHITNTPEIEHIINKLEDLC